MVEKNEQVTVENLVDSAIIQGFKEVPTMFLENIEESLRRNIIINESGSAQELLQTMLDQTEAGVVEEQSIEQLNDLQEKMKRVMTSE